MCRRALSDAYGEFLRRYEWQWFATLTYRNPPRFNHVENALRHFRKFTNRLSCEIDGKNWSRHGRGVHYVVSVERHLSGDPHVHALIGAGKYMGSYMQRCQSEWRRNHGLALIESPYSVEAVCRYVTKTAATDNEIEYSANLASRRSGT